MRSRQWSILIGLLLLAGAPSAFGERYVDPSGFSFDCPDGWVALPGGAMKEIEQAVPREMQELITRANVDLRGLAVLLIQVAEDEPTATLNVMVQPEQMPINDDKVAELAKTLPRQYAGMGFKLEDFRTGREKVGSRDVIVVEYHAQIPGASGSQHHRQVVFVGGGKSYLVTCGAPVEVFEEYRATFDNVLASFQVPPPVAPRFDWNELFERTVIGAVAGGMIGGLGWVALRLSRKPRPAPETPAQSVNPPATSN
jgi:hypothetical protein